jgi:uncharacterized membrane protein YkvA (DUF1232 family)
VTGPFRRPPETDPRARRREPADPRGRAPRSDRGPGVHRRDGHAATGRGAPQGKRGGTVSTVLQGVRHIPAYLRLLVGLLFDARVATLDKVLVVGAIAFVVSPIDLIPNMIPVLGELDDLFVVTLALQHLVAHADEQVLLDHWSGDPEELTRLSVGRMMAAVSFFLPLSLRGALRRRMGKGRPR